jgi:hypothetical protein
MHGPVARLNMGRLNKLAREAEEARITVYCCDAIVTVVGFW